MDSDDSYASSDEDQLLSEDERPVRASRAKAQPTTLDLGRILVDPVPTVYSCRTLYEMMHHSELDLDPEYQRDVVWQDSDQCALIDSLLRNYYVPPVILAKRVQEDGGPVWTCIDGKQRLTSIQRFMDGMIPFRDKASKSAYYYKSSGSNKTGKALPEPMRRRLENVQLVCVIYNGITLDDEREIFQRVQFGKDLKKDEKWRAKAGKNPMLVKKVLGEIVNCTNGLASLLPWDKARGKDFACVAEAIYRVECLPNTTMKISLTKWLDEEGVIDPTFEMQVLDIFRIFLHIARDPVHSKVFRKHSTMFSPVEFIMTAVLIGKYRDRLSLAGLVAAIDGLRTDVRSQYKDVKNNGYCKKAMYIYINKKMTAPVIPLAQTAGATVLKAKPAVATVKRKRSESPDAPLAQALQKRLRSSISSASTATPARPPPAAKVASAPSTFRLPKLKAPGAAPMLSQSPASTQQATPPPAPETATPTPAPATPTPVPAPQAAPVPLSSVFQPEEDVKPIIRPTLHFQPTPIQRPTTLSALQASAAQARKTFEASSGGQLGQRAPLFFEKTRKPAPT
ncbi:hypothetical protein AURDEDRAFT_112676 [Auricularia subglabra TFB-10046 SS5]|nr:hypothetical protein AURDEDRAFT_112676 [Auricularia subglabra TFB-10046 SS5]